MSDDNVNSEISLPESTNIERVSIEVRDYDPAPDTRLYVPDHGEWGVEIKRDSERIYCYAKLPGEDWFHLILNGEIYVTRQHERYCLRCALRMNFLTQDRLFWQRRVPKKPPQVL